MAHKRIICCVAVLLSIFVLDGCVQSGNIAQQSRSSMLLSNDEVAVIFKARDRAKQVSRTGEISCYSFTVEKSDVLQVAVLSGQKMVNQTIYETCGESFYLIYAGPNHPLVILPMK